MFIDKTNGLQVKVPNGTYVDLSPYLVEVKYDYPKLFAEGSGRNLSGTMISDFIGVFPKITCQFGPLDKTTLQNNIIPIIDSPRQVIRYYDPNKKAYREMTTYTGDYSITNRNVIIDGALNEGFEVSFIAVSKRS